MRNTGDIPRKPDTGPEYCSKRFLLSLPEPLALHKTSIRNGARAAAPSVSVFPRASSRAGVAEEWGAACTPGCIRFSSVNRWRLAAHHPSATCCVPSGNMDRYILFPAGTKRVAGAWR